MNRDELGVLGMHIQLRRVDLDPHVDELLGDDVDWHMPTGELVEPAAAIDARLMSGCDRELLRDQLVCLLAVDAEDREELGEERVQLLGVSERCFDHRCRDRVGPGDVVPLPAASMRPQAEDVVVGIVQWHDCLPVVFVRAGLRWTDVLGDILDNRSRQVLLPHC